MDADLSRLRSLIRGLALRAVAVACDGATTRPRAGVERFELVRMLPAARRLLALTAGPLDAPPVDGTVEVTDGAGHRRPVYRHLAWWVHHRAGGTPGVEPVADAGENLSVDAALWAALRARAALGDAASVARARAAVVETASGSLQPDDPDEAPDHWTFRELTGLHALHALGEATGDPWVHARVAAAAAFHLAHTQPDYTTYQPWALAAFLALPETVAFAEQQLHDVATHLAIAGGPGAVVPALLLADACASLGA